MRRIHRPLAVHRDAVGLRQRLAVLALARLVTAATVAVAVVVAPDGFTIDATAALVAVALAVVATSALELARRARTGRFTAEAVAALDGVFLAGAIVVTGGADSVFVLVATVHLVVVTLLVSYRTGLTLALWTILLLVAGLALWTDQPAEPIEPTALTVALLLLAVAGATAGAASFDQRALRTNQAHLQVLADLSASLATARRVPEVAEGLATALVEDLGLERVAVLLPGDVRDGMPVGPWDGLVARAEATEPLVGLPTGHDARLVELWQADQPVVRHEPEDDVLPDLVDRALPGSTTTVAVPLRVEDSTLGILAASWSERPTRVPPSLLATVAESVHQAALALRTCDLLAEVERLASHDPLTGLANRRTLDAALSAQIAFSRRHHTPVGFVMLDLDHFKRVNDTFGHQVGDDVLRRVGEVLQRELRAEDLAARIGGEEFVVLLPGVGLDSATATAERLRDAIAATSTTVGITASAGVAALPECATDGVALRQVADEALYRAKRQGRDQAVAAPRAAHQARLTG